MLFICLVAFSTLTFSCADDKKEDLTGLITYFKIKVNNEVFEGTIDEGTRRISFQGIKSISGITDVEYQLKTGASIYPSPETRLDNWQTEERFIVAIAGTEQVYTVAINILPEPEPEPDAIIHPEQYYGRVIKDFFLDLKLNLGGVGSDKVANEYFVLDGMNGVRIPVLGSSG